MQMLNDSQPTKSTSKPAHKAGFLFLLNTRQQEGPT
nr:MAG TPA: hypothetical protein [Caudoviricetes sp.]